MTKMVLSFATILSLASCNNSSEIKFNGTANSESVEFGGGKYCTWSIKYQNVKLAFTYDEQNSGISHTRLSNDALENTVNGDCQNDGKRSYSYVKTSSKISGNDIEIIFSPAEKNKQKCNARFDGIIKSGKIKGAITWNRYDQDPELNYTISVPIELSSGSD